MAARRKPAKTALKARDEALRFQAATAEILASLSRSRESPQPVFDAIVENVLRLFDTRYAVVFLVNGEQLELAAVKGDAKFGDPGNKATQGFVKSFPQPIDWTSFTGQAMKAGEVRQLVPIIGNRKATPRAVALAKTFGYNSIVIVPLLLDGRVIGAIGTNHAQARRYSESELAVFKAFAAQAVIAIENARLFNETNEALEKQTATARALQRSLDFQSASAEILASISRSIADTQPVFDAIVASGVRLLAGHSAAMLLIREGELHLAAYTATTPEGDDSLSRAFPMPLAAFSMAERAARERSTFAIEDVGTADVSEAVREASRARGWRSALVVPLLRQDDVLGLVSLTRREPGAFAADEVALVETFAAQAVIAIENARLFNETKEALERQKATADILRVIAASPGVIAPVLRSVAESAALLCQAKDVLIRLVEQGTMRAVEHIGAIPLPENVVAPPITRNSLAGRAILECRTIHVPDVTDPAVRQEYPDAVFLSQRAGLYRTVLDVPMVRDGTAVGVIVIRREEARPFSEQQVRLLETFADQAVIAIENARLFNETKEALERQTATAEVLRVMSGSLTDVQPVLDAVAERAARLCGAVDAIVMRVEGDRMHRVAHYGDMPSASEGRAVTRDTPTGRAIVDARTIHVADIRAAFARGDFLEAQWLHEASGFRTVLCVPLMREGAVIGAITIRRLEVRPFSDEEVALLTTFADQAAIAIENVRLFNETREALEQQKASAEVLRVISSSPTDVEPVFEAIVQSGVRLFEGAAVAVCRPESGEVRLMAIAERDPEQAQKWRARFPFPLAPGYMHGRAILECRMIDMPDVERMDDDFSAGRGNFAASGYRALTVVPMVKAGAAIGTIAVIRRAPGPLSDKQIALLKTFADQAVIAIENARLFNETREALERQTATAEILRVISSSTTDTQPVFEAIVRSAAQLFPASNASIFMRDGDLMGLRAVEGATVDDAMRRELGSIYPIPFKPEVSTSARAMVERRINICLDTEAPDVPEHIRRAGRAGRFRSNTVVPLVRDDEGIGTIVITHPQPGHRLNEKQLALLRTFADQAVIAIENTRLFNETKEALDQQKASAEVLGAISGSIADTQPVFQKILTRSERLFAGELVGVTLAEGDTVRLAAYRGPQSEPLSRIYPLPLTRQSGTGWAILNAAIAHFPDIEAPGVPPGVVAGCRTLKVRAIVFAPMLFEGKGIGAIWVARSQAVAFSDKQISQLRTFADQAVIAIQNARLFREIQDKSAQLEIADRHKSEFLANMSHELRTPLNAIIGFSEVLLERMFGELNEKQADYLKDIHESGRHLLSLINDILDLSKIEAGRMELELSRFSLPGAIGNAMTLVRERAQRHGIELGTQIDPALGEVQADERKVKQILLNLLSNAVKFTPEGGRVDVSAKLDTDRVEISVKDTGAGISADDQARLFEEFRQVGADAARKAEGTGLGLALTKKFVELHGGAIRVESAPGKGSTFSFSLPLAAAGRPASSG